MHSLALEPQAQLEQTTWAELVKVKFYFKS